jgi:hypothetical protein
MKAYQQWCTGAFDVADRDAWPVAQQELRRRAAELQVSTSFVPVDLVRRPSAAFLGEWWQ